MLKHARDDVHDPLVIYTHLGMRPRSYLRARALSLSRLFYLISSIVFSIALCMFPKWPFDCNTIIFNDIKNTLFP